MSFQGKIFRGKRGLEKAVTTGEAIQKLRETEDMLMKKQVLFRNLLPQNSKIESMYLQKHFPKDFLKKKIETEVTTARKNAKTNKHAALQALNRKKRWENIVRTIFRKIVKKIFRKIVKKF